MIRRTPAPVRTLLVVGHDPALPGLARTLAEAPAAGAGTGEQAAAADRMRAKFPTAAVAAFVFRGGWDRLAPGAARLACFVTPRELRAAGNPSDGHARQGVSAAACTLPAGERPGRLSAGGGARLNPRRCRQRSLYRRDR